MKENRKILITGGLGYLGGRIAHYLRSTYPDMTLLLGTRGARRPDWTVGCTLVPMALERAVEPDSLVGVDAIIHLAASNELESERDPMAGFNVTTLGTYRLLEAASMAGVGRFLYFSTLRVYGNWDQGEITEDTPTAPFHPYAFTHRAAEDVVRYFGHYKKMNTLVLRLSNACGFPMNRDVNRWNIVCNDLCKQAVTTGRIVLHSSGRQHRDFICIEDIARAVGHLLGQPALVWKNEVYNLGGECSLSILEMAQRISTVYHHRYGKPLQGIQTAPPPADPEMERPVRVSIEKLKATGFVLQPDMEREIVGTLEVCEGFLR